MKVLVIDDDVNLGKVISFQLSQSGYEVDTATSGEQGLQLFRAHDYDIVISDIQMPDLSGIDLLKKIRRENEQVIVIMITAYGSVDNAVEACNLGADDYLTKPFGKEQLLFTIEKAVRFRQLQTENQRLKNDLSDKFSVDNMVAKSGVMQEVLRTTHKLAQSDANVLIMGESGTGKEIIARAIHYNSRRKDKPLVTVNCPSVPGNLLESELFGHVRGAFTGAIKDRKGKFEEADGGTIFLDEIGDLQLDLQAKLLRVLQEQEFSRLGESRVIKVDVRVIAATNRDLFQLVQEGKFREDLYYRLSVVPIVLPPLRKRVEDIPYLVDFFLQRYAPDKKIRLSDDVYPALMSYHWPGNIRELENLTERLLALASGDVITLDDLPGYIVKPIENTMPAAQKTSGESYSLEEIEKNAIIQALEKANGNQTQAARLLQIPRHVLLYRMKKFGLV